MTGRRVGIITVAVFVMAAAGAVYAALKLVPPLVGDPRARSSLRLFIIVAAAALVIIPLAARLVGKKRE